MKKILSLFLSLLVLVNIFISVPFTAIGANMDFLVYELNEDGKSYSVIDCDESIQGELDIPSIYNGFPVTSIGSWAFGNCRGLTSITIPNNIKSIGYKAFYECCNLNSVYISDMITWCNLTFFSGDSNPMFYAQSLYIKGELIRRITIPDGITSIGDWVFYNCGSLTSVTIPSSVTNIGDYAFYNCGQLASLIIPDSVTTIGDYAFCWCDSLASLKIGGGVKNIGNYAFQNCLTLYSITIPQSVTSIGGYAFDNCTNLTSVAIPDSVTSIGRYAFLNTSYYNNKTNWEDNVLYIDNHLIKADTSITGNYIVKSNTTVIADNAFDSCKNLISLYIPNNVTNIGNYAFNWCTGLSSISISDNISHIKKGTFYNCISLTSIIIPDSITIIEDSAFYYCHGLKYVFFKGNQKQWEIVDIDSNNIKLINAIIHYETNDHIVSDWIIDIDATCNKSGSKHKECIVCGYSLDDEVVSALGHNYSTEWTIDVLPTCSTEGYKSYHCSRCDSKSNITVIPTIEHTYVDGVCTICEKTEFLYLKLNEDGKSYYVSGCDKSIKGEIIIPKTYKGKPVTSIGFKAFYDCTGLTSIIIPDTVTNIEGWAFFNTGIYNNSENWEDGVLYIGNHLIKAQNSLSGSYSIKEGTVSIAGCAFPSTIRCTSITIPISIKNIGESAFECCYYLKYVFYTGAIDDWKNIEIGKYNTFGELTAFHYESIDHTTSDWITDIYATVDEAGSQYRKCTQCGEVLETTSIPQLKPATPKLSKIQNTASGTKITWGKVSGADEYKVYRKTYNAKTKAWSGWSRIATGVTSTSYVDKTAKSGTYYRYTVIASNEAGNSGYDTTGLKTYFLATPTVSATNSNSGVTVKWSKSAGATGYYVYRKTGTGNWQKIATVKGASKVSYTDTKAKSGVTYRYTVKAYYGSYVSAYNTSGTAIRRLTTPTLKSVTNSKSGVTFNWNKVAGATGYIVYRKTGNGSWQKLATVKTNTYLDKTAKKGVTYKYTVKAYYGTSTSYYNTKGLTIKDKY